MRNPTPPASIETMRSLLLYEPETGVLRWRVTRGGRRAGTVAGSVTRFGYVQLGIGKRFAFAHKVAWAIHHGEWPEAQIDHINRIKTDNRIANLRSLTPAENAQNQSLSSDRGRAKMLGVSWKSRPGRWVAQIRIAGKQVHLGYFDSAEKAAAAYAAAKRRVHPAWVEAA